MRIALMITIAAVLVGLPNISRAGCPLYVQDAYEVLEGQRFDGIAIVMSNNGEGVASRGQLRLSGAGGMLDVITPPVKPELAKPPMGGYQATLLVVVPHSFRVHDVRVRQATNLGITTVCDDPAIVLREAVTPAAFDEASQPTGSTISTGAQLIPEAKIVDVVPPIIPDANRAKAPSSGVWISVTIRSDGPPAAASIMYSSGDSAFDEAALVAAKASLFDASRWDNIPVPLTATVRYGFYTASQSNSSMPTPTLYPAPGLVQVKSLCTAADTVLGKWNFVSPYLLCYNYDAHTEGVGLFMDTNQGFMRLRGAGGVMDAEYLVRQGVPSATATALVSGLHS